MKVLFITTKCPLPVNDGHSLRTFNLLRAVAKEHEVFLLSFVKYQTEYEYAGALEKVCSFVRLFSVPQNLSRRNEIASVLLNLASCRPYVAAKYDRPEMRAAVRELQGKHRFDLVHLDMLPLGVYLDDIRLPVILNEHNVESRLLARKCESLSNPFARFYYTLQHRRLEAFEAEVVGKVAHAVVCSHEDGQVLQSMTHAPPITVVPNGVDTDHYRRACAGDTEEGGLVFVGGMNWFPNLDGVRWFDEAVLPELLTFEPDLLLDVVGRRVEGMRLLHGSSIVMHGFVEDTRPYLESAKVVVVPIRVGGGTRLKVLEAMSMGKAIVSTSVGVEGISVTHGHDVLIADTPAAFARAVSDLVRTPDLRRRLGAAARELVLKTYRWDAIGRVLLEAYRETTKAPL